VLLDKRLAGVVSIGDVVKCQIAQATQEAESLRTYIAAGEGGGSGRSRALCITARSVDRSQKPVLPIALVKSASYIAASLGDGLAQRGFGDWVFGVLVGAGV